MIRYANRVFFEDTNCLTTLFYIGFLEDAEKQKNSALAEAICALNDYDLILLLGPDVAFVQDGDRSETIAADREKYTGILRKMCEDRDLSIVEVNGDYQQRYLQAVALVDSILEEADNASED